jgi:predicted RNA-binding protein (virulence factor B family)
MLRELVYLRTMELGKYNVLSMVKEEPAGLFLEDEQGQMAILFKREWDQVFEVGKKLRVFVYNDAENPFIATLEKPNLLLHQFGFLKVVEEGENGAFLDWGIAKDLFVPFAEQQMKMLKGKSYLVYLYLDKVSNRLVASAKVNKFLDKEQPQLQLQQEVDLLIATETDLGYNVIINERYKGLVYRNEVFKPLRMGDRMKGFVKLIREDGKIDVSLQKTGHGRIDLQESRILSKLRESDGFLPFNDNSDPDDIYREFEMSKKTFKRTISGLYKQRLITITEEGISLGNDQQTI